jgi:hypothetical protein
MTTVDELRLVFDELNERADSDPRLERYRVDGLGEQALEVVPPGWFLSDCIAYIVVNGGWWPGYWHPILDRDIDTIELFLNGGNGLASNVRNRRRLLWCAIGNVFDPDRFCTPLSRQPRASAPLCGVSSQAHWVSMVFPDEASLFKAFLVTYDELGFEDDHVNQMFVEWITDPPRGHVPGEPPDPTTVRVHHRLVELAADWSTDHPCWMPGFMPALKQLPEAWPAEVCATVLGVEKNDIDPR